ncbi:MAG TPA: hypothetical protein VGI70_07570 [Polyangiales bacterium]
MLNRFSKLILAAIAIGSVGCASNIVLRARPALDPGPLGPFQRCEAGETPCANDAKYDSSLFNHSHTTDFSLPSCDFGIQEILIQNAGASNAVAIVRCAAPKPSACR